MLKKPSFYTAFICAILCSGAIALQPTVRAGSLSLNAGNRPTPSTNTVTPTASINTSASTINRGSAISKFSQPVTKVTSNKQNNQTSGNSNNNSVSSEELDRLREQIERLTTAQQQLADTQVQRNELQGAIEDTVASLDLKQNSSLQSTLEDIDSVQDSLEAIQNAQNQLNNSIDTVIDNSFNQKLHDRLVIEGFIEENEIPFAKKKDIKPDTIVEKIVTDPNAAAAFSDKITADLKEHSVLKQDGSLNVATKAEIAAVEIADKISKDEDAQRLLSGKIGPDATAVNTLIDNKLVDYTKTSEFLDENNKLKSDALPDDAVKSTDLFSQNGKIKSDLVVEQDLSDYAKTADILDGNKLKDSVLPEKVITSDELIDENTQQIKSNLVTQPDLSGYAQKSDFFDGTKLKSDALPDGTVTSGTLQGELKTLQVLDQSGNLNVQVPTLPENIITKDDLKDIVDDDIKKVKTTAMPDDFNTTKQNVESLSSTVSSLGTTVSTLGGNMNTPGSILNTIKTDESVRELLQGNSVDPDVVAGKLKADQNFLDSVKGESATASQVATALKSDNEFLTSVKGQDGSSVTVNQVTDALKADSNFLASVKGSEGPQGPAGTGIDYKGEIASYSALTQKTCNIDHKGNAWYNLADSLLYICTCEDSNCAFPGNGAGVPFRGPQGPQGEPGQNAKTPAQQYCEDNYAIVKALYPNKSWTNNATNDCANTSLFSNAEYSAIMGGAKSYCLSLVQTPTLLGDLSSGIGKKLKNTLGEAPMSNFINTTTNNTPAKRLALTGFKLSKTTSNTGTFMEACEARYDEIMSGADGADAETAWYAYCEANAEGLTNTKNLVLIQKLYPNANISTCDDFTQAQYAAIIGGAEAYCASLTKTFESVSLNDGIGLKFAKLYVAKNGGTLDNAKTQLNTIQQSSVIDRFDKSKRLFGDTSLTQACIDNYNAIMSGEDGADGETPWHAYCVETDTNNVSNLTKIIQPLYGNGKTCDNFTSDEYNAIMGGAKAYCLSLAKDPSVLGDLTSGIGLKLKTALGDKVADFKSASTVQARLSMTGFQKASSTSLKFTAACEEKYNEIMSGADGLDGESADEIWCREHSSQYVDRKTLAVVNNTNAKALPVAKGLTAFSALKATNNNNETTVGTKLNTTTRIFATFEACMEALAQDPSIKNTESASEEEFSKNNTNMTLNAANVATLGTFKATGFKNSLKGADGKTMIPSIDNGTISWSAVESASPTATNFDLNGFVGGKLTGYAQTSQIDSLVNTAIGQNTTVSNLSTRVGTLEGNQFTIGNFGEQLTTPQQQPKEGTAAQNMLSDDLNRILTVGDLVKFINVGALTVNQGKEDESNVVTINTNALTSEQGINNAPKFYHCLGGGSNGDERNRIGCVDIEATIRKQ